MRIEINTDEKSTNHSNSLMEVYVLDFGDNYHRLESEPTSEFEKRVRKIKRRYRKLIEYNDAVIDYNDWMDYLASKYGGHQLLQKKIKYNLVTDFIPHKPKLKDSKTLKYFYKNGIVIGETGRNLINESQLDEFIENINLKGVQLEPLKIVEHDKDADKIIKSHLESMQYKQSVSKKSDIDFLDEYFKMKNKSKKKSKKKKESVEVTEISLTDLVKGEYLEEITDTTDDDTVMMINGRFMTAGTSKELDVYHQMNEIGWNSYKLMKKSDYGKSVTKIFKDDKKKKKKERKGKDKLIVDIMSDNGYDDFEDFVKDMEDFTASNIFNK